MECFFRTFQCNVTIIDSEGGGGGKRGSETKAEKALYARTTT